MLFLFLYKREVQYVASKEEQPVDALEAGAGHSIHMHSAKMKGRRRKLHIVNFTICVTHQIRVHAEAQLVEILRYKPEGCRLDYTRCY